MRSFKSPMLKSPSKWLNLETRRSCISNLLMKQPKSKWMKIVKMKISKNSKYNQAFQVYLLFNTKFSAKQAFEAYASKHNVTIKHYHCENGCFHDNLFVRHVQEQMQTISYTGVNAHFQNRWMLLHAKARWSEAVSINLWPYALRNANNKSCMIPDNVDGTSK